MRPRIGIGQSLLALGFALFAVGVSAQTDYRRVEPPHPAAAGGRVEVLEFFYYGCPVCYETEPLVSRWLSRTSDYVAIRRVPALSSAAWEPFAKLYYTLEALGQVERLHWPVYDSVHFEDMKLGDETVMVDWAARNGIDREKFVQTYGSRAVADKTAQARDLLKSYEVRAVPTFIVDGKFLTSARLAGGTEQVVQVLDRLVGLAREERVR